MARVLFCDSDFERACSERLRRHVLAATADARALRQAGYSKPAALRANDARCLQRLLAAAEGFGACGDPELFPVQEQVEATE